LRSPDGRGIHLDLIWAALLGALQGVTEWLPVSSSGHLVIVQRVISYESVLFDAMVHGGTLLAVIVVFRTEVLGLVRGLLSLPLATITHRSLTPEERLAWYTLVGTVPIVLAGLLLADAVEAMFSNPEIAGIGLFITGFLLLATKRSKEGKSLDLRTSLIVGLAQVAAIVPGISRSGSTISAGMISGLKRDEAVTFSFLLSVPAIAGALTLEVIRSPLREVMAPANLVGFVSSFAVGVIAIKALLAVIRRREFHLFAYYCFALGLVVLLLMN